MHVEELAGIERAARAEPDLRAHYSSSHDDDAPTAANGPAEKTMAAAAAAAAAGVSYIAKEYYTGEVRMVTAEKPLFVAHRYASSPEKTMREKKRTPFWCVWVGVWEEFSMVTNDRLPRQARDEREGTWNKARSCLVACVCECVFAWVVVVSGRALHPAPAWTRR